MSLFQRSTRSIVTGKRPTAQDGGWQTPDGDGLLPPAEGIQKDTEAQKELGKRIAARPRWLLPAAIGLPVLVIAVAMIVLIGSLGGRSDTQAVPAAAADQAIVAVQADAALTEQAVAGDVVRIYGEDGLPVPELRYVEVYKTTDGELLLLMDEEQAGALVRQGSVQKVALVVHNDTTRAAELLDLQRRINDPEIRVTLGRALSMAPGEEVTLDYSAEIQPEEAVLPELVWASDNPEVVTVADGAATATGVGTATITLSCGGMEARCAVTVIDLRLSETAVTLGIGETARLTADAGDGFQVTFASDNPEAATVAEDGTITGVTPGTATVTAACEGVTVTCQVTVGYRAEVAQLDAQNMALTVGSTAVLTPAVYPGQDVIDAAVWETDNPAIATVTEDGTVTAVAEGTAIVTYRCGAAAASCTIKVEKP